jgi:hypothetical protein
MGIEPPKEKKEKITPRPRWRDPIKFGDIRISEGSMHGSVGFQGRVIYL